jgi:selenoprotein W-related protein
MGDELKKNLGAEIELIAGANGIFDVTVDGKMIFSKFEQGRFPQRDEIISLIQGRKVASDASSR